MLLRIKQWLEYKKLAKPQFFISLFSILFLTLSPLDPHTSSFLSFTLLGIKSDQYFHFLMFFILGISLYIAYPISIYSAFFLLIALGLAIEVAQELMPFGRQFDFRDLLANLLGIFAARLFIFFLNDLVSYRPR